MYYAGYGWYGSLNTLEPGMGLVYYSAGGDDIVLTYPGGGSKSGERKENVTSEGNRWEPDMHAYADNMTVVAAVELDGEELRGSGYELAVFAGGECRGSVRLMYVEPVNRYMAFLTVGGDETMEMSYALYNVETGEEYYGAQESLEFEVDGMEGSLEAPRVIRFNSTSVGDKLAQSIYVYPNPVERGERFSLGMNDSEERPVRIEMINALGVLVKAETLSQWPASMVAPATAGVYTLKIVVDDKTVVCKRLIVK